MEGSRAALRYAKALLNLAREKNIAQEVNQDMRYIGKIIAANEELGEVLKSPVVPDSKKKHILVKVFTDVNTISSNLFKVLLTNNRIGILPLVVEKYNQLYDEMNGVQIAKVTTAVPLTAVLETKIQEKVKSLTGNVAKIVNIIDESLLGGFILRVGDLQYNASVSYQLKNLGRRFINNTYVSKI